MKKPDPLLVVCFGEMLYDYLPEGRFPGGAPMNVALHLHQQGLATQFISSVGQDEDGKSLFRYLSDRNLPIGLIQVNEVYPTGRVIANVEQSDNVQYDILQPVAWDHIGMNEGIAQAVEAADLFLFGSLAARHEVTRSTLERLLKLASRTALDINLRAPHYSKENITPLLEQTSILKMNEEELALLMQWYLTPAPTEDAMQQLADRFALETVCITQGAEGATLLHKGRLWHQPGFEVTVADTIGSGDAFLATLLSKLLRGDPPPESLRHACAVGAYVASQSGATPELNTATIEQILHS